MNLKSFRWIVALICLSLAMVTTSLIEGIDSVLGVLDAQAGTYMVTKNTIRFEDPAAAREYAAQRQRIGAALDSAAAMPRAAK